MLLLTPHVQAAQQPHWVLRWLGDAWLPERTCWDIVREVQQQIYSRTLPADPGDDAQRRAMFAGVLRGGGWQRVAAPTEGDVLSARNADGLLHVAVAVPQACVLHSVGGLRSDGQPWGGVRIDRHDMLGLLGFGHLKWWRHG